jgi:uncharacterized membrane protein YcaP (DUF421 family)
VAITDLLVVVLLADAAQNAMADEYRSISDGLILVGTIIFWNYFLDWLGYRFPAVDRILTPSPLLLIKDGELIRRNMRREFIAEKELMRLLRVQGVEDVAQVRKAYLEGDGRLSVFTKEEGGIRQSQEPGPSDEGS